MRRMIPSIFGLVLLLPVQAQASSTSGKLPWNNILTTLEQNITGPTATAIILIAIAVGAIVWAVSEDNRGVIRILKAVVALGIVAGLTSLVSGLGISASTV